jgi:hypothetical protein
MPGNPQECRERAKRCSELAAEAQNEVVKQNFMNLAKRWSRIAADLEATQELLKQYGEEDIVRRKRESRS